MKTPVLLTLLLLFLLPLLAAAQVRIPEDALRGRHAEYQQGFRDGFREAMRMMNQGGSGAGWGQPARGLRIDSAVYGSDKRRCDFTRALASKADGQREYKFQANNLWCGDPHKGRDKVAEVRFSCRGKAQRIKVPERSSARLRCD